MRNRNRLAAPDVPVLMHLGAILLIVLSVWSPLYSQTANGNTPPEESLPGRIATATVNVVVAPTTVVDKNGQFINGLEAKDFVLLDNGKEQAISPDITVQPISLVVAIQSSSGIEGVLPQIKKIGPLIEGLVTGEHGEAALVAFDHRVRVIQEFTNDGTKLKAALEKLNPGASSSRMVDAVMTSARMLRSRPQERRRVLLLVSETRDRASEGKLRDALTEIQFANVSVYTINISRLVSSLSKSSTPVPRPSAIETTARVMPGGQPATPTTTMQLGMAGGTYGNVLPLFAEIFHSAKSIFVDNPAEVLTKFTGGTEFTFVDQKTLEQAVSKVGEELHSQYLIAYNPNNKEEGGWHRIEVLVKKPNLEVRTRPGYWIAAQPQPR